MTFHITSDKCVYQSSPLNMHTQPSNIKEINPKLHMANVNFHTTSRHCEELSSAEAPYTNPENYEQRITLYVFIHFMYLRNKIIYCSGYTDCLS